MPVRTRSHDREKQRSPAKERLYPTLDGLGTDDGPKRSPYAGRHRRKKAENYRDAQGNDDSSDADTDILGDDDDIDFINLSSNKQNLSHQSRGSQNESFVTPNKDSSFVRASFNSTRDVDDSFLDSSKVSHQRSPRSDHSFSSPSMLDSSSPGLRKRSKLNRHEGNLHQRYIATETEAGAGTQPWTLPDYCVYCVIALGVLLLVYVVYLNKVDKSSPIQHTETTASYDFERLNNKFEELQKKFPNQTERHWKIIKVQLKKLFRPGRQTQPAIILFAAKPRAVETMNCIAKEIGNAFAEISDSKHPVLIHGGELAAMEDKAAKLELDNQLLDAFQGGHRVVIMFELESFHGEPLLLLHSYCDHENAAFKDVVIMFTLHLEESDNDVSDEFIEDYLGKIWQGKVGVDEMGALRSRIANNKVISREETEQVLNRHCS